MTAPSELKAFLHISKRPNEGNTLYYLGKKNMKISTYAETIHLTFWRTAGKVKLSELSVDTFWCCALCEPLPLILMFQVCEIKPTAEVASVIDQSDE